MLTNIHKLLSATIRALVLTTLTTAVVFVTGQTVLAYDAEECISCHSLKSTESHLTISIQDFQGSAHGESFTCLDCHTGIEDDEHMTIPGSGRVDCGQCHDQINRHGSFSGNDIRPQCYHCHTKHRILAAENDKSTVFAASLSTTCRSCHPVQCGHISALSWLPSLNIASHSKQDFSQSYRKDNCIGCHQGSAAHGDTAIINDQVCYVCHAPLGENPLLAGHIHVSAEASDQPISFIAGIVYTVMLVLLVFGGIRYWFFRSNRNLTC